MFEESGDSVVGSYLDLFYPRWHGDGVDIITIRTINEYNLIVATDKIGNESSSRVTIFFSNALKAGWKDDVGSRI